MHGYTFTLVNLNVTFFKIIFFPRAILTFFYDNHVEYAKKSNKKLYIFLFKKKFANYLSPINMWSEDIIFMEPRVVTF